MIEYTLFAFEKGGKLGGLGFIGSPVEKEKQQAKTSYIFRRGDCRIHVLIATGNVTMEQARQLAINLYEGKTRKVDMNDAAHIDRIAALWSRSFS